MPYLSTAHPIAAWYHPTQPQYWRRTEHAYCRLLGQYWASPSTRVGDSGAYQRRAPTLPISHLRLPLQTVTQTTANKIDAANRYTKNGRKTGTPHRRSIRDPSVCYCCAILLVLRVPDGYNRAARNSTCITVANLRREGRARTPALTETARGRSCLAESKGLDQVGSAVCTGKEAFGN
eukprot:3595727-Rhodomonas_salina.1